MIELRRERFEARRSGNTAANEPVEPKRRKPAAPTSAANAGQAVSRPEAVQPFAAEVAAVAEVPAPMTPVPPHAPAELPAIRLKPDRPAQAAGDRADAAPASDSGTRADRGAAVTDRAEASARLTGATFSDLPEPAAVTVAPISGVAVETHFAPAAIPAGNRVEASGRGESRAAATFAAPAPRLRSEPAQTPDNAESGGDVEATEPAAAGAVWEPLQRDAGGPRPFPEIHHTAVAAARDTAPLLPNASVSGNALPDVTGLPAATIGALSDRIAAAAQTVAAEADPAADAAETAPPPVKVLTVILSPPEYGAVVVRLRKQDGEVAISIRAGNEETTRLLAHDRERIAGLLRDSGLDAVVSIGAPTGTAAALPPSTDGGAAQAGGMSAAGNGNDGSGTGPRRDSPPGRAPAGGKGQDADAQPDRRGGDLYV